MLHNVNLLYLGLSVHILCDASYISRLCAALGLDPSGNPGPATAIALATRL